MGSDRQLIFRDDTGHEASFMFGAGDHLKFMKAFDRFLTKRLSEDNTTFRIERVLTDETLVIETAQGILGRMRSGDDPQATYRRYEQHIHGGELQAALRV